MLRKPHPLIEAAIEPLKNNAEQRVAAITFLEGSFDQNHPDVPKLLCRFEEIDRKKRPNLWKLAIIVTAALALGIFSFFLVPKARLIFSSHLIDSPSWASAPEQTIPDNLTKQQRLLLGDPSQTSLRQSEDLLESDPSRADFYAAFLQAYLSEYKELPEGYFETIRKIDPDNAYFYYLGAAITGREAVKKIPRTDEEKENDVAIRFEIKDVALLEKALGILRQARDKGRCDSYFNSLLSRKIPLLKQEDYFERVSSIGFVAGKTTSAIYLRTLADVIAAEFQVVSEEGNVELTRELLVDYEQLMTNSAKAPVGSLVESLVSYVVAVTCTRAAYDASARVGLASKAKELKERKAGFDAWIKWRRERSTWQSY